MAHKLELRKGLCRLLGTDGAFRRADRRRGSITNVPSSLYTTAQREFAGDIGAGNCYSKTGLVSLKKCFEGGERANLRAL